MARPLLSSFLWRSAHRLPPLMANRSLQSIQLLTQIVAIVAPADALEYAEDAIPKLFVELRGLEIVGIEQHLGTAARAGFALSRQQQPPAQTLAAPIFTNPQVPNLQIAAPHAPVDPRDYLPAIVAHEDRQWIPIRNACDLDIVRVDLLF